MEKRQFDIIQIYSHVKIFQEFEVNNHQDKI